MIKPIIAVAIGDPAGIGPEIALAAEANAQVRDACRPLLVGHRSVLEIHRDRLTGAPALRTVAVVAEAAFEPGTADVLDVCGIALDGFALGAPSAQGGRAILDYAG
jgi:4-hydroxy-L-threonine phosphate dehydrogenase PdxA